MPRHVTQLGKFLPTGRAFVGLIVAVCLNVVLEATNFAEYFFAVVDVTYEELVHTLCYWVTVIRHGVLAKVNRHHVVLRLLRNLLLKYTTCLWLLRFIFAFFFLG